MRTSLCPHSSVHPQAGRKRSAVLATMVKDLLLNIAVAEGGGEGRMLGERTVIRRRRQELHVCVPALILTLQGLAHDTYLYGLHFSS